MKLILFPLTVLVALSFLSVLGLGSSEYQDNIVYGTGQFNGYFDANGHQAAYDNQTAFDEAGIVDRVTIGTSGPWSTLRYWRNATGSYQIWTTPNGTDETDSQISFNMSSSVGLIAIIIAVMAATTIAGIKFFGSGITNAQQIFTVTVLLTIWGVFSIVSLGLIATIPLGLGLGFYFFLTLMYSIGIVNAAGGNGGDGL